MTQGARSEIEEIVDRETRAWDRQDVELLLSVFHHQMVWPWPPEPTSHDPIGWVMPFGRFDEALRDNTDQVEELSAEAGATSAVSWKTADWPGAKPIGLLMVA